MQKLCTFSISSQESEAFAQASGDFNPLHLDSVAARRTQFGRTLIHGVFGALKALEVLYSTATLPGALTRLNVKFSKPIGQGDAIEVWSEVRDGHHRVELLLGSVRSQIIDITCTELTARAELPAALPAAQDEPTIEASRELTLADSQNLAASTPLRYPGQGLATLLPVLNQWLPATQLASILACTRIVGMECPGLHSVFARLSLEFPGAPHGSTDTLAYAVRHADPRLDRLEMSVTNAWASGTIEAFFRARPVQQVDLATIQQQVRPKEFAHQSALIIGGSRGLGEVAAKALAAGGAQVAITYATGAEDAQNVSAEIGEHAARARPFHYDVVTGDIDRDLQDALGTFSHIYYFASPAIAKSGTTHLDEALLARYRAFYQEGLEALVSRIEQRRQSADTPLLFVPSSVFVEETPKGFTEYATAKAEVETWCAELAGQGDWRVSTPRLPRLHTDQTSTLRGLTSEQTLTTLLTALRRIP